MLRPLRSPSLTTRLKGVEPLVMIKMVLLQLIVIISLMMMVMVVMMVVMMVIGTMAVMVAPRPQFAPSHACKRSRRRPRFPTAQFAPSRHS